MLKFRVLFLILPLFAFTCSAVAQVDQDMATDHHNEPFFVLLISGSGSEDVDSSKILGAEMQLNWRNSTPFTFGFHGMIQQQKYGEFDNERWGVGVSVNHYFQTESLKPYIGIKNTWYFGMGDTEEALDCLYCSDIEEDYSGGEAFVTAGLIANGWTLQVDWRITDNRSEWSENAYDPWGVGASYRDEFDGIPDPEVVFHVGYSW
jgi:hypothetical protein